MSSVRSEAWGDAVIQPYPQVGPAMSKGDKDNPKVSPLKTPTPVLETGPLLNNILKVSA